MKKTRTIQEIIESIQNQGKRLPETAEDEVLEAPNAISPREFIGLSFEDAKKKVIDAKMTFRVTLEDGKYHVVTRDLKPNRVNFEIVNGKIVNAAVG